MNWLDRFERIPGDCEISGDTVKFHQAMNGLQPFIGSHLIFQNLKDNKWVFPKIMVPQNGWFIMEYPTKMDDLGIPLFLETSKCF